MIIAEAEKALRVEMSAASGARVATADEGAVEAGLFTATVNDAPGSRVGCGTLSEFDEITATVTSGSQPTSRPPTLTEFMSAVVAWPASPQDPGFVNLHYSSVDRQNPTGPLRKGSGWPFRSVDSFVQRASWMIAKHAFKDAWFCLSLQSQTKPSKTNPSKPRAHRLTANALKLKAIWADVDVGPKKLYKTIEEALKAVIQFRERHGLPPYSAIVASGGGLQIYWISTTAMTVQEWRPFSHGLRALLVQEKLVDDPGVTTDEVRLLRVPGTFNHKPEYGTPRPVQLLNVPLVMYDFPTQLSMLPPLAGTISHAPSGPAAPSIFADGVTAANFGKPAFVVNDGTSLQSGIDKHQDILLKAPNIFKECGFYQHALMTGGVDYSQPLWMLSVLGTTFMENGNAIAHAISQGHPQYTQADTQALYDRKVAERADRGIGYPSCAAIAGAGCEACNTCPLFSKIKSPLNLATRKRSEYQSFNSAPSTSSKHGAAPTANWADPLDFNEVPDAEAVARINEAGYFVLTLNGDIYKQSPSGGVVVQKREGFNNLFACRKARLDDGKSLNAGAAWKSSSQRREYDSIGYWPGDHDRPNKSYNLWRGWGVEPKEGDWSIIDDLIRNVIADGDCGKADFILNWLAQMVQRPWEKPGVALVLRGRKGTGKSLLTGIVARAIGKSNTLTTANGKSLFGTFNWHLADKLLICAEEAFFAGNREQNDQLKHLLTGTDIEFEQKFGQRVVMKSMHRLMMTSNHNQVVAASDDERRYFVCDVSDQRKGDDPYFVPLVRVLKGEDDVTLAAFMYELVTRDIKDWKAEQAARNANSDSLARQKLLSLEPPLQWLLEQIDIDPKTAAVQGWLDVGSPTASDIALDQRIAGECGDKGAGREQSRAEALESYRRWAKNAQVRGATEYAGAETFWANIKRLLNNRIFPGRRLFRCSGATRFVIWPPRQEMIDGFNRLLGGKVVGDRTGHDDGLG